MRRSLPGTAALAAFALLGARAGGEEVRAISDRYDEPIVSITVTGGRAILKTEKHPEIPLELVKHIRFDEGTHGEATGPKVILLNRDELRGSIGAWDGKNAFKLKTSTMGELDANLDAVAAVFLEVPPENERKLTTKLLAWLSNPKFKDRPSQDTVYLKAGGKTGGTVEEVSSKGITLNAGKPLGTLTFPLKDVEALVLGDTGKNTVDSPKGTAVRVRCADGSLVSGAVVKYAENKLVLDHPLGTASAPLTIAQKDLLDLFVLNGAFVYLSDLEPSKVDQKFPDGFDYDANLWGWKRDKEVCPSRGRLRLAGRSYEKGLGVHTYCALTYTLGGAYKEFRAVIGLDDSTKFGQPGVARGSACFRVLVDGKPAKELPEGKKKSSGDAPDEIAVDVQGVKELQLVADYGQFMHINGHADWADAHLVKAR